MSNKKHGIRYTTLSYIEKAREIHSNSYDYSKVIYKNSHTKITIICPTHGEFLQQPYCHINSKQGCPKCSHNFAYTHNDFVFKSTSKYLDKFTIASTYTGMKHPITIKCKEHGLFLLKKAEKHLEKNGGCPSCWYLGRLTNLKPGNISKAEKRWLDSLNVPLRQEKIIVNNSVFLVDGFDPLTNTVYEYYGSYWHGNPEKYSPNDINPRIGKTFGELYQHTINRENQIKQFYNLITLWG
jgi:hypothetical protein